MSPKVLVVEDDPAGREVATLTLRGAGMEVASAANGDEALLRFRSEDFDAVVLDIMLPGIDGVELCRQIRRDSSTPVVMLTAKDGANDVVAGLEAGADDYVTKPFHAAVLVARLQAVVRRANGLNGEPVHRLGDLTIDLAAFSVRKNGWTIELSPTEGRLLGELLRHQGTVITRRELLARVWDYDYLGDSRMVDMAVKRLRDRIEDDPHHPRWIVTVRGVGYRLDLP